MVVHNMSVLLLLLRCMQIFEQWTASLTADNKDCWHTLPMPQLSSGYVQQQSYESRGCSVLLLLASYVPTDVVSN